MKKFKLTLIAFMLVITPALLMAGSHGSKAKTSMDIVDTAVSAGSFNTLAAALKAADLVDVLKGQGPFTVFAPTDEAFDKLPEGTLASLLKPENKEKLQSILTYHVVSGQFTAKDVTKMNTAKIDHGNKGVGLHRSDRLFKFHAADLKFSRGLVNDTYLVLACDHIRRQVP